MIDDIRTGVDPLIGVTESHPPSRRSLTLNLTCALWTTVARAHYPRFRLISSPTRIVTRWLKLEAAIPLSSE